MSNATPASTSWTFLPGFLFHREAILMLNCSVSLENVWPQTFNLHLLVLDLSSWGLMSSLWLLLPVAAFHILVARSAPHTQLYCRSLNWASSEMIPTCIIILKSSSLILSGLSLSFLKPTTQNRPYFSRSAKYSKDYISLMWLILNELPEKPLHTTDVYWI